MEATTFACLFISPSKMFTKFNICGTFGLGLIRLKLLFEILENGFVVTI